MRQKDFQQLYMAYMAWITRSVKSGFYHGRALHLAAARQSLQPFSGSLLLDPNRDHPKACHDYQPEEAHCHDFPSGRDVGQ